MREFTTAATRGRAGFPDAQDVTFKLDEAELTAKVPTTGQIALFVQKGRSGGLGSVESLLEFFSDVLDEKDWNILRDKLRDGMDVDLLAQISTFLIGEWSGRPTRPSSASSPTRNGTGRQSTAKRPVKAATRSGSR